MTEQPKSSISPGRKPYPTRCPICGGEVVERLVTLTYSLGDDHTRIVSGVPAGVCRSCGEQYLTPQVTKRIEELLSAPPSSHQQIPVWDYAASA